MRIAKTLRGHAEPPAEGQAMGSCLDALGVAAVKTTVRPQVPPARNWSVIPPLLTADEVLALLCCGRTHLDALIEQGLPHLNIGHDLRSGAKGTGRTRRMLRFELDPVLKWLRGRATGGQL